MRQLNLFQTCFLHYRRLTALLILCASPALAASALTLADAERYALQNDPTIQSNEAFALSLAQSAIADGQLADPRLNIGLYNLPTDDFDVNKNPTTQLRFGIQQQLPKGNTLQLKEQQGEQYAQAKKQQTEWLKKQNMLDVRLSFLETYYQQSAVVLLNKNRRYFVDLLETTQNFYSVGRANQQDVFLAKLELSRLDDRMTKTLSLLSINKARLGKWVPGAYHLTLANKTPTLTPLAGMKQLESELIHHPLSRADEALIDAAKRNVLIAQEQYKPGFNIGFEYRQRFGDEPNGAHKADMLAAMISVDLPIFPEKRQDKRLSASQYDYQALKLKRLDNLRQLRQQLYQHYGDWQRLLERSERYKTHLLKQASANTNAALQAYHNSVIDFSTLITARITELETRLQNRRIEVDALKAQARVLFLSTEGVEHEFK